MYKSDHFMRSLVIRSVSVVRSRPDLIVTLFPREAGIYLWGGGKFVVT